MESKVHCREQISRRNGGFTLLELLLALAVLIILIGSAAPSFEHLIHSSQLKRLATEIEWLMAQAKSEAVMRGENVYITATGIGASSRGGISWSIEAKTVGAEEEVLAAVDSGQFPLITVDTKFSNIPLSFDSQTGRPANSGRFILSAGDREKVNVVANCMTGRLYVCSEQGGYGYGTCSQYLSGI